MKKTVSSALLFALSMFLFLTYVSAEKEAEVNKIPQSPPIDEKMQIQSAESLGNGKYRIGRIIADTENKEVTVPGVLHMNDGTIEYIASIKGGHKLYETIFEMDANAYEFNLSLILIGLDQKKGKAAKFHFDPASPEGDEVEIWVEWEAGGKKKSLRAEELIYDAGKKAALSSMRWVYTGSTVLEDGQYVAQRDGVLIGFVHDPAAIIDSAADAGLVPYGMLVVNKKAAPPVGTKIILKIKSLKKDK
ncbi:MAG: hypothetical protein HY809_09005 [Nitrospirae bacterium]|nr:hypothetical protein [Nitrospirota bacterium]